MAPNAPNGAAFMTMAMTPNTACAASSMKSRKVWPRSPSAISAKPNRIENSSTCRMSPWRRRRPRVSGMMLQDEIDRLLRFGLLGVGGDRCRIGHAPPKPVPDLDQIADDQPDHQREGRDDLEIDQRLDADAADLLGVLDVRDAGDDRAEDDRRDHHLDQLDEAVAQRLDPVVGRKIAATASRPARRAGSRSGPGHRASCTRASPARSGGAPVAIIADMTFTPPSEFAALSNAVARRPSLRHSQNQWGGGVNGGVPRVHIRGRLNSAAHGTATPSRIRRRDRLAHPSQRVMRATASRMSSAERA